MSDKLDQLLADLDKAITALEDHYRSLPPKPEKQPCEHLTFMPVQSGPLVHQNKPWYWYNFGYCLNRDCGALVLELKSPIGYKKLDFYLTDDKQIMYVAQAWRKIQKAKLAKGEMP